MTIDQQSLINQIHKLLEQEHSIEKKIDIILYVFRVCIDSYVEMGPKFKDASKTTRDAYDRFLSSFSHFIIESVKLAENLKPKQKEKKDAKGC